RRFLKFAAMAAAGAVVTACSGGQPSTPASAPTSAPAAAAPAAAAKPTAAPTQAPAPTAAPINVSTAAQPTTAPAPTIAASKYKEAPMLADLVKSGKLPSVDKRLPDSPRVITPLQEVGEYGSTWHRAYSGLSDRWGPTKLIEEQLIRWNAPDVNTIQVVPNVIEKWEQSADATQFTFHFRKGLKWSDGQDVTQDDMKFWYEDMYTNKTLVPTPTFIISQNLNGKLELADVSYPDPYSVQVKYKAPFPLLPIQIAKNGGGNPGGPAFLAPSHYLKQFHAKYTDQTKLDALAKGKGYATWTDLWGKAGDMQGPIAFWMTNPDLPVLFSWKIQDAPPKDPMVMVRNPYYWQVDNTGNQLPYIDRVEHALFQSQEVLNLWVASGKIDAQMRHMSTGSYTFYKENEKKGGYQVQNWRQAATNCYYFSLNCPDPVLAKLFDTPDFRQAVNLAVNRSEVNQIVWNGLGVPRQYSPVKGSPEYDEGMTTAWANFDVKTANALLDKLGLKKGSDGMRQRPDGKPLEMVMEHTFLQGDPGLDELSLMVKYWKAIGIKIDTKYDERALYETRVHDAAVQASAGFGWDRSSVVEADPGRWLATIDDGPWAPAYGHWYAKSPYKQIQPPADHPIRKIWNLWDQTQVEPDEAKRNALFQQLIGVHKSQPFAVGVVGELALPSIVRTNFRNIKGGYIDDDTLRDYGLINPQQFYIKTT
ncbi:MAG TPA: ABC transporter substrate-binding protein, partial [Chloroflexota bacterium]|nr:ABC transporter substrate-binding protein [Chloroflexota bacterium]